MEKRKGVSLEKTQVSTGDQSLDRLKRQKVVCLSF
jgi:hypothetical protein